MADPSGRRARQVREVAARHLTEIRDKLDDLKKLERLLAKTIAQCSSTKAPHCPVLDILDVQGGGKAHGVMKVHR